MCPPDKSVLVADASHALGNLIANNRHIAVVNSNVYADDTLLIACGFSCCRDVYAMH